ncbi:MAG TPA: hypothetical protein VFT99_12180 [Roseiflexaceae bacterium]|nr:hypothetical protein [Roseiflexaceae bacterium]
MSTDERYLELDADEYEAVMEHRAAKRRSRRQAEPRAPQRGLVYHLWSLALWVAPFLLIALVAALAWKSGLVADVSGAVPQAEQPPALPTARVAAPAPQQRPVVVVPAPFPQDAAPPAVAAPVAPQEVAPQPVEPAPVSPQAQPDQIGVNADLAAGGNGSTAPLPEVLPTVVPAVPVSPYNPADPTAAADWERALRNSGVDVAATEVACNADLAAGGAGCQP